MYSSSYSQAKFGLEAREPLHRSKGKSCGYYMRIIFFFSSLIQSLIIVSLVLFLIYGQPEKTAVERRVEELEVNFNKLSEDNVQLRKEKAELGAQLAARTAEKTALEKEMEKVKAAANTTEHLLKSKLTTCEKLSAATISMMRRPTTPIHVPVSVTSSSELKTMQSLNAQQKAMINLIQANFTQTVQFLSQERDIAQKDRDLHHHDAIILRRDNAMLREQLTAFSRKCKEDFAKSLDGINTVTRNFLNRINNLFPHQLTFHLTCDSQREQMEKIRNSCTNLSRDVENKFQMYLDNVGNKVAEIQFHSSGLEVQVNHASTELQQCQQNFTKTVTENQKQLQLRQTAHDLQMEKLLVEQNRLRNEKNLQEERLALREKEVKTLQQMIPVKPGAPRMAALQAPLQPDRQTVANWPSVAANGLNKPPTGR